MPTHGTPYDRYIYLLGHRHVHEFINFVKTRVVDGRTLSEVALADEWQHVRERLHGMDLIHQSLADMPDPSPLSPEISDFADAMVQQPSVEQCLGFLPKRWGMVELDRLIVRQKYVNRTFAEALSKRLPSQPTLQELVQIAAGQLDELPPVSLASTNGNNFIVSSPSSDVRILGTLPIKSSDVSTYCPGGRVARVLGIFMGFSVNFIWAIQMGSRLMLSNGTHRAYALRTHGLTHVPCLITRVSRDDDLDFVVGGAGSKAEFLATFAQRRPPLLRDYFDNRLHKELETYRNQHAIQLSMKFDDLRVPLT